MTNTRAAVAILLAVVGLVPAAGLRAEIIEQILVKVNGEIFTKSDLEQRQVSALRQKGQQIDLKNDAANQQLRKALDEITPQIMVDAVDEMLLVQRGKELGYKLSDEQFKGVLDNIKKENKLESEEQFQAALKAEGITMADLRRNLERSMLVQRVQQNEVMGKIGVSEDEARKYYESHLSEFTTPQSVTLREILVALPADNKGVNVAADEVGFVCGKLCCGADGLADDAVAESRGESLHLDDDGRGGIADVAVGHVRVGPYGMDKEKQMTADTRTQRVVRRECSS